MGKMRKPFIYLLTNTKLKIPKEKETLFYHICTLEKKKSLYQPKNKQSAISDYMHV